MISEHQTWFGPGAHWTGGQDWRLTLPHTHGAHRVIHVTRGQGLALMQGARRGLGPNTVFFVPAGSLFALEGGWQTQVQVAQADEGLTLGWPTRALHLRLTDLDAIAGLAAIFDLAGREMASDAPFHADAMAAHAGLLAVWLKRQVLVDAPRHPEETASTRLATRLFELLPNLPADALSLPVAAAHLGVGETHLSRACRQATGRTAKQLIARFLQHEAFRLLSDTDAAVQDIARHLGFGSAAYFSRFVQSHAQMSPRALRAARLAG